MDACRADQLEELGIGGKRLPRWLLPASVGDVELDKIRPDIVRVLGLPLHPLGHKLSMRLPTRDSTRCRWWRWDTARILAGERRWLRIWSSTSG